MSIKSLALATVMAAGIAGVCAIWTPSEAATCRARISGQGSGQGVAGAGTEVARSRAAADWSSRAQTKYGAAFTIFSKARDVRYDCRQGAILEAKCVVTARPCR